MSLSEIVEVVITRQTTSVTRAGFGTALIIGPNVNINSRIAYFTTAATAIAALIGATTLEEDMITALFSQSPSVTRIALGSLAVPKITVVAGTMTAGSISATVNGTLYSAPFNTSSDQTLTDLAALIQADANVVTAVNVTGTITVTPVVGLSFGITYDITAATGVTSVTTTSGTESETYDTALALILIENPDFYGILAPTRVISKQQLIATWTQANKKIYAAGTADTNVINQTLVADTTSIAALAKTQALTRTFVCYGGLAATEGIEAAVLGKAFPLDPGSYTCMFKTLATITVDALTATQSINARAKNANTYEAIGGVNIFREGKVGSGEFIDVIIFIDWLEARIQESVFAALVNLPKVPFTNEGITTVEAAVDQPLQIGQNRGGISPDEFDSDNVRIGGYVITVPALADVSAADKAARTLDNVRFTAFLAGAIHKVTINGIVTL